jgi:2-keto-4-pentenoate hydratase/2-oxohepta-3-ene-1,7-dioic acid hydratase in catechol pathway
LVRHLSVLAAARERERPRAKRIELSGMRLSSPLTSPSKVMAAPANYRLHVELDTGRRGRPGAPQGARGGRTRREVRPVLKATSVMRPSNGVQIILPDRRTDHEVELAVIIGKSGHRIARADAMSHVAGYCIGLDMTVRGAEDRSFRKSPDSYAVLGPWLVTADEIPDPHDLALSLWVNGNVANTRPRVR